MTWPKVAVLSIYVLGALAALIIGENSSEAIAYMLAGAAANQGAVVLNGNLNKGNLNKGKKKDDSKS